MPEHHPPNSRPSRKNAVVAAYARPHVPVHIAPEDARQSLGGEHAGLQDLFEHLRQLIRPRNDYQCNSAYGFLGVRRR
jgi:hypothetical protein